MSDFPTEEAVLEPKRIQVFGVLHIVFGALALLNVLGGMVMMPFQSMMLQKQIAAAGTDEEKMILELQQGFYDSIGSYNWLSWILAAVIGILLLVAGIMLLKRRMQGLKLSVVYFWCAVVSSIGSMLLFLMITKPAVAAMMEEMFGELGVGTDMEGVKTFVNVAMAVMGILIPVFGMIYPTIQFTMLRKDSVRRHLK